MCFRRSLFTFPYPVYSPNMFLPMGWALNPTLVPSFVPTTSNMHERRSLNPRNSLPEYSASDRIPPPAYTLRETPGTPARPKEAHTRRSRYEALAGPSSSSSAEEYAQMHNVSDYDMEANMAAAIVCIQPSCYHLEAYTFG